MRPLLRRHGLTALAFGGMAALTWGRWPDAHIDFGLQAYEAWRVAQGEWPVRDLATLYGPLSPALNGLAFRVLGEGLWTLFALNLALTAVTTALLHRLLRRAWGQLAAQVGALIFLTVFAFGHVLGVGNYTFVAPYLHHLTHGVMLALGALLGAEEHRRTGRRGWRWLWGLCLGLALLTKPEPALAALLATTPALVALKHPRRLAEVALAALLPPLLGVGAFATVLPFPGALRAAASAFLPLGNPALTSLAFFEHLAGLDDVPASLLALFRGTAVTALGLGFAVGVARAGRRPLASAALSAVALFSWQRWLAPNVATAFPAGLALLALGPAANATSRDARAPLRLALVLLATALLLRMALAPRVAHYGFALAMPAGVILAASLVRQAPALLRRWWDLPPRASRPILVGAVVGLSAGPLLETAAHARAKTEVLGTGRDAFLVDARGPLLREALDALDAHTTPGDAVAVLPDGAMLNYLARRRMPTRFTTLAPPEFHAFGAPDIEAAFTSQRPRYVLLLARDFELPPRLFGVDYAQGLWSQLSAGARVVAQRGAWPGQPDGDFGWVLYELPAEAPRASPSSPP